MRAARLVAAVLGAVALVAARPVSAQEGAEPVARGKKLSEWLRILEEGEPAAREAAATVIGRLGVPAGPAAVRPIAESLAAGTARLRANGAWALGCIAGGAEDGRPVADLGEALRIGEALREHALAPLATLLRDAKPAVRLNAAWALGCIRRVDPAAVEALLPVLAKDTDDSVRTNAAWALYRIASGIRGTATIPEGIVPALAAALEDANQHVRSNAASGLHAAGEAAVPVLPAVVARLRSREAADRTDALAILGNAGTAASKHADEVKPLLADPAPEARLMAVAFFLERRRGLADCLEAMLRLLDDRDERVRLNVVSALASMPGPPKEVEPALRRRAGVEKDPAVLKQLKALLDADDGGIPGGLRRNAGSSSITLQPSRHHSFSVDE